ncbi:MAG TPA: transposase [Ktedonobacterales bacterium]|nr:transposase [Ktedonobacterales bacterium]
MGLDEMGPDAAKRYAGQQLLDITQRPTPQRPAARATQELDEGRRGNGSVFGAFQPATGAVLTGTAQRRTTANFVTFLEQVDTWIDPGGERVYALLDNLSAHRATDVLRFALAHPRWEFVFPPTYAAYKYAAYLHVIAPWWKILRSLALRGRRFASWAEICAAVEAATA